MVSTGGDDSLLEDHTNHDPWDSPARKRGNEQNKSNAKSSAGQHANHTDDTTREQVLRQELANVRKVNEAIEGVLANLQKAKSNMKTVNQTVGASSSLLNTWTRILSQTEHNQRLILDPSWQGASQDMVDIEEEAVAKQQAAERREQEEQERKAAAQQKAEEERRRAETANVPKSTTRGRGRAGLRGSSSTASASANTSMSSSVTRGTSSHRRTASGIGRGIPNRSRGRG